MPDLGFEVLWKGKNFARLLGGLGVALRISLIAVAVSMPLGVLLGLVMTLKHPATRILSRLYLEFVRIMPQLVLLFLAYFGATRSFGWDLSGEFASMVLLDDTFGEWKA